MDRLISEKQVLDAVDKVCRGSVEYRVIYDRCEELIKAIPSAEYETEITKYSDDEKYKALITLYFASINCEDKEKRKRYNTAIKLIEGIPSAEPKTGQFAKWVATEIFDDMWEYNKDSFAEIACRKLEKLGIVRAKGDEWELVEPTCDTCEYSTASFNPCNACKDKSEYKPKESEDKR